MIIFSASIIWIGEYFPKGHRFGGDVWHLNIPQKNFHIYISFSCVHKCSDVCKIWYKKVTGSNPVGAIAPLWRACMCELLWRGLSRSTDPQDKGHSFKDSGSTREVLSSRSLTTLSIISRRNLKAHPAHRRDLPAMSWASSPSGAR